MGQKVLFLTNSEISMELYKWLKERCDVELWTERLELERVKEMTPQLIVSYNYRWLIKSDVIDYMRGNIINLHISYLPWNRGASPNFWSFVENTPKGVTIHQISAGLDEGKILYQKRCVFDEEKESFETTHKRLNVEIMELFKENWEEIWSGSYTLVEQSGEGSYHTMKDLKTLKEKCPFEWSDNIADFLERYQKIN